MKKYHFFCHSQSQGHSFYVNKNNEIFGLGESGYAVFGLVSNGILQEPTRVHKSFSKKIKKIAIGGFHVFFFSEDFCAYGIGYNGAGQLALSDTKDRNVLSKVTFFGDEKIENVFCGRIHTLFYFKRGNKIYGAGWNTSGQLGCGNFVDQEDPLEVIIEENVIDISAGLRFTLFLTKSKDVYKCGTVYQEKTVAIPEKIFIGEKIQKIYAGYTSCVILTMNDNIFSLGNNKNGQLGISIGSGLVTNIKTPTKIVGLSKKGVIDIRTASKHTLALTKNGEVWALGECDCFGYVGKDAYQFKTPKKIMDDAMQISVGLNCSFVMKKNGRFFAGGSTEFTSFGISYAGNHFVEMKQHPLLDCSMIKFDDVGILDVLKRKLFLFVKNDVYVDLKIHLF